jgi:sucrose-phosphate synthase
VDLVTRRVLDPAGERGLRVARRAPVGEGPHRAHRGRPEGYIPKEQLWDHLDALVDNLHDWLREQGRWPDLIHSHYADAGYVGVRLSHLLGVPLVHTGHSLGRDKRQRLLAAGMDGEEIDRRYAMVRRIEAEEETLANADLVIASTRNEIEEQYGLYDYYHPERMVAIPPGTDLTQFHPPATGDPPHPFGPRWSASSMRLTSP